MLESTTSMPTPRPEMSLTASAEAVSDISGRGVGMDVVLSNIKKIGGSVQVRSRTGQGTRMTLRLPLTLAVLDVMLVKVAQNPYVIPLSSICLLYTSPSP